MFQCFLVNVPNAGIDFPRVDGGADELVVRDATGPWKTKVIQLLKDSNQSIKLFKSNGNEVNFTWEDKITNLRNKINEYLFICLIIYSLKNKTHKLMKLPQSSYKEVYYLKVILEFNFLNN